MRFMVGLAHGSWFMQGFTVFASCKNKVIVWDRMPTCDLKHDKRNTDREGPLFSI